MKKISLIFLLLLTAFTGKIFAKNGYHIKLKIIIPDDSLSMARKAKDTVVFLAHYYAKGLPTIYKTDSAKVDENGVAVFKSDSVLNGGIYLIYLPDQQSYFDFLLNNGDDMSITMPLDNLPYSLTFSNSPENELFKGYESFLKTYGEKHQQLLNNYKAAKNAADSESALKQLNAHAKELTAYRKKFAEEHPHTLLASIFNALELPVVPEGKHLLPDGKEDSTFAYDYYKKHFWDKFDFQDDRLINTPIYDARLNEYFNKLVFPSPDSVEYEADRLLSKTKGTKELFKYTLNWVTNFALDSKIMGMDVVFVYLVDNYYMKGEATWLNSDDLAKYIDRAAKIMPNVIGNVAPEIKMVDVNGKEQSLLDTKAKYTLLVFWRPDCGHCQKEVPEIDSLYRAVLKKKGVKVFAVKTEDDDAKWKDFIEKHHLGDWINVRDTDHTREDYRAKYDVYSTPTIYLLDENKIIRGKKLDHSNIYEVIEMLENKEKKTKVKS